MKDKPVILAVDDQLQNIELLEACLVGQGYEIVKAASGEEALEKLVHNQIDLILLDVMMSGMSGLEVLKKLRADERTLLIPVVMITVLKETEEKVKAIEAGCDDFISKPFDRHELLARIKSLLRIKFLHGKADEAEEKLNESEKKYRSLFVSSNDAIMTLEPPTWKFTSGNPATIEMFKAKNEEDFLSYEPWKLSPERQPDGRSSAEKAKEMIEKAKASGGRTQEKDARPGGIS